MKEIWIAFLKGAAGAVGVLVAGGLATRLPPAGHWAAARFADLEALCRTAPTILLFGVPLFLLALCISFAALIFRVMGNLSDASIDLKELPTGEQSKSFRRWLSENKKAK